MRLSGYQPSRSLWQLLFLEFAQTPLQKSPVSNGQLARRHPSTDVYESLVRGFAIDVREYAERVFSETNIRTRIGYFEEGAQRATLRIWGTGARKTERIPVSYTGPLVLPCDTIVTLGQVYCHKYCSLQGCSTIRVAPYES